MLARATRGFGEHTSPGGALSTKEERAAVRDMAAICRYAEVGGWVRVATSIVWRVVEAAGGQERLVGFGKCRDHKCGGESIRTS